MNPRDVLNQTPRGQEIAQAADNLSPDTEGLPSTMRKDALLILTTHYFGPLQPRHHHMRTLAERICGDFPKLGPQSLWYDEIEEKGYIQNFIRARRRTCLKGL